MPFDADGRAVAGTEREVHRRVAGVLRARRGEDDDVTTALGHHVVAGGLDDLPIGAVAELWEAGRVAVRVAEWGEAARMFEISPYDPVVFGGIALLLAATGLLATLIPARRASRADPATALRYD